MKLFLELLFYIFFESLYPIVIIMGISLMIFDKDGSIKKKMNVFFEKHYLFRHFLFGLIIFSAINWNMVYLLGADSVKPFHVLCWSFGWMTRKVSIWIVKTFYKK
jgi:hypothetical protein